MPQTVPDTAPGLKPPPRLTLILPGLMPDPSGEPIFESTPEPGSWQDSPLSNGAAAGGSAAGLSGVAEKNENEALLQRFDWQRDAHAVMDSSSDLQSQSDEPWECTLMRAVGAPVLPAERLPGARLRWPLDQPVGTPVPQHVVCADPVHLQVDRDSVSVIPPQALFITLQEARSCAASINALLSEDGLEQIVATPESWYLTGGDATGLSAAPTHAHARRKIATSIADDAASARWRQLSSELQMLLHSHPVNESRASRGLAAINSLWFCGGDALPEFSRELQGARVFTDDAEALALVHAMGVSTNTLAAGFAPDSADSVQPIGTVTAGDAVWVDLSLYRAWLGGEPEVIASARSALIQRVIVPALDRLAVGAVSEVSIEAGDGLCGKAVPAARPRSVVAALLTRCLFRLGIGSKGSSR